MNYYFHPEAEDVFLRAVEYFDDRMNGLGFDFAIEVYLTIDRILTHPKAWTILKDDIRRSLVKRFSYAILYTEKRDEIYIIAVMNLRRKPDYWKHRL